jgi:hypothetical protein
VLPACPTHPPPPRPLATREDGPDRTVEVPAAVPVPGPAPEPAAASVPVEAVGISAPWGGATRVAATPARGFLSAQLAALEARAAALFQARSRGSNSAARAAAPPAPGAALPGGGDGSSAGGGPARPASGKGASPSPTFGGLLDEIKGARAGANAGATAKGTGSAAIAGLQAAVRQDALGLEAAPRESLGERVLGATVRRLLDAAAEALRRPAAGASAVASGAAPCEATAAAGYIGELLVGWKGGDGRAWKVWAATWRVWLVWRAFRVSSLVWNAGIPLPKPHP